MTENTLEFLLFVVGKRSKTKPKWTKVCEVHHVSKVVYFAQCKNCWKRFMAK